MTSSGTLPRSLPVAAPRRVAAWLTEAPDGPVGVLHSCPEIVHLDVAGRCVSITAVGVPGLPTALRTNLARVSSQTVASPYLGCGTLTWDGRVLAVGRLVDVRAPRIDARVLKASPAAVQGTPRSRVAGLVAVPETVAPETVPLLVGRGEGLTPLGDDVLVGWLALHRAVGVDTGDVDDAVRRCLDRTTMLSATLLECALAGEVADPLREYLAALGTDREAAARALLESFGASSGSGLAHGVRMAAVVLARAEAA